MRGQAWRHWACLLVLTLAVACSPAASAPSTGLMVIISTNLGPTEFDSIQVSVSQEQTPGGSWHTWLDETWSVPAELQLPTTVFIQAGSAADQDALLQVSALLSGQPVVLRVAQVQIPTDRVAEIRLVLAESCKGHVQIAGAEGEAESMCPAGQSCQPGTGACGDSVVPTSELPTYAPGDETMDAGVIDYVTGDGSSEDAASDSGSGSGSSGGSDATAASSSGSSGASSSGSTSDDDAGDATAGSSSGSSGGSGSGSGGGSDAGDATTGSSSGSSEGGSSGSSGGSDAGDATTGIGSGGDAGDATTGISVGTPTMLPTVSGTCPTIPVGASQTSLTFNGEPVDVWTGDGGGPLVMFWFETAGSPTDVENQFGTTEIAAVTAAGGMVASFAKSTGTGTNTGDAVWYTGDFVTADQVVACAIQQLHIDTQRIFTTGASAGGLQSAWLSYARSGYIAAAAALSGGILAGLTPTTLQDPTNVPSVMAVHGAEGVDVVVVDFAVASANWEADINTKGGFSIDCNTGGGHVSGPPQILPGMWQFFVDHPFKVSPQPYPPIPGVYPSYCVIGPRNADGGAP